MDMWSRLADRILDHPRPVLAVIISLTAFLGYWSTQVKTNHTAGQFLPTDSQELADFDRAGKVFGQSQTILYIVFKNTDPYDPGFLQRLNILARDISQYRGVEQVLSLTNIPYLVREGNEMVSHTLYDPDLSAEALRKRFQSQPFLRGLLLSKDGSASAMMIKIEEAFNDTPERVDLVEKIEATLDALPGGVAMAGFPYLRTQYAQRVTRESPLFTLMALIVSLVFLFITFRAWKAVVLPTVIVLLGIVWTIGLIALFDHRLNIVTAVLPALIVIIGMATSIHICTKFYDQYALLGDRRKALVQTIRTVGLATFLTSFTTAIGFGVLVLSGSRLLTVFGAFAAVGIMLLYGLSVTLIPFSFLKLRPPSEKTTNLVTHDRFTDFFDRLALFTQRYSKAILAVTTLVAVIGVVGALRISSDIFVFSDFYKDDPLRQDLAVFEDKFGGVLPMEVVIESKKEGQFRTLGNLRRMDRLETSLDSLSGVSRVLSVTDLVKLANQSYFGGNPATYRLPSSYEMPFLQAALKGFVQGKGSNRMTRDLPAFVDSTFTVARIQLGVGDLGTAGMNALADSVRVKAISSFPENQFDTYITGTAIIATRSGENLVKNLILSLAAALLIISFLMALLFRSKRLTVISLIPNMIPLLLVGGAMGFAGIALKPSTALIFSLSFGIAVDDTIHFLAKYRLLRGAGIRKDDAIRTTLRETGKAILFTSLVLMAGFMVFTLSSFGGTVNMGALTALTLAAALVANLFMLPALLYRFGPEEHYCAPPLATSGNGATEAVRAHQI